MNDNYDNYKPAAMDKPYTYMVIERGTRNTYGCRTVGEALARADSMRNSSRSERIEIYALISTDPRD